MDWLVDDCAAGRDAHGAGHAIGELFASYVQTASVWHAWDMRLKPGQYRLSRVSADSVYLNIFYVGSVPVANQPAPILPAARFGTVPITSASVPVLPLGYQTHDLLTWQPVPLPAQDAIDFQITSSQTIVRVESWAKDLAVGNTRFNTRPLPPGFPCWRSPMPIRDAYHRLHGLQVADLYAPPPAHYFPFGFDFPSISKRTISADAIAFAAEDSVDGDHNDLVVTLRRIG